MDFTPISVVVKILHLEDIKIINSNGPLQQHRKNSPDQTRTARNGRFRDILEDFMEAVFPWMDRATEFIQFRPEPTETWQNRQPDTVTGFLYRIPVTSPIGFSWKLGISWRAFARNSRNYCFRNHRPGSFSNFDLKLYTEVGINESSSLTKFLIYFRFQSSDIAMIISLHL